MKEKFVAVVICPPILFWKERPKKGFVSIIDGTPSLLSGTPAKIKFVVVAICEPILLWNTLAKKRFVPVVDGAPSLLSGTPAKVKFVDAAICELMLRWKELPGIEFVAVAAGVDGAPIVPGLGLVKGKFVVDAVVCAPTGAAKIPDAKNKTHVFISL
ncbi:MAG TPA: hypothetical protein VGY56_15935 [Verrucomicrobiae bacterium]|nr:hypothetical protein [Verrucomicrobiae bacterium]